MNVGASSRILGLMQKNLVSRWLISMLAFGGMTACSDEPDDFVIATGEMHSVREFLDAAFGLVGRRADDHVVIDARYLRPTEVDELCGDPGKAASVLGWKPTTPFTELVRIMVSADLQEAGVDPASVLVDP